MSEVVHEVFPTELTKTRHMMIIYAHLLIERVKHLNQISKRGAVTPLNLFVWVASKCLRKINFLSAIAQRVVKQVLSAFPDHQCYSGPLKSSDVQNSSLRDAEMFQTYIWVCLLENNVSVVQQELFPLCVMLYPTFNVKWQIVRYMLTLLEREFGQLLAPEEFAQCASYLNALKSMFSPDVVDAIA